MKKWLGIFIRNEYLCSQVNAGVHRTYSMFVCTFVSRQTLRIEVENVLHLLFYILKKEKAKKDVLGEGLPIYDGIDLPVSLIRRNNQGII